MRYTVGEVVELLKQFPSDRLFGMETSLGWIWDIEFASGKANEEKWVLEITAHGLQHDAIGVCPSIKDLRNA